MFTALLLAVFLPIVDRCGSPLFRERERAELLLAKYWPLSQPAVTVGLSSPDLEIRHRCKRIEPVNWRSDLAAACLVSHVYERDGIPFARPDLVPLSRPDALRQSCLRLAGFYGFDTSDSYYYGEIAFWSHPTGYDRLRFEFRGVWPQEARGLRGMNAWLPERVRELWHQGK